MSEMQDDIYTVQYSLLVKDDQLASVIGILISELKEAAVDWEIIKAQLLTLMLRLKRGLNKEVPLMTDGLYSRFPENEAHPLHHPVIERVHQYIQLHLHESLTPAAIAAEVQVTPDHLNRILKTHVGISTMNYVIRLRMEAAQLLLRTSDLSVQEISQLVGYRQLPHFSRTFHRHSGQTPLRYRQQKEPSAE
jgi:AraC-like DNA-binding protein